MAVVLPLIAAVAGAAASSFIGGGILGALVGAVVTFAVSYAAQAIIGGPKQPRGAVVANELASRTQQTRQAITHHRVVYGRMRVSAPMVFIHTNAAARTSYASAVNGGVAANYQPEALIYLAHAIASHQIDWVEAIYLNDVILTDERYRGLAHIEFGLGRSTQNANAMLIAETDGQWVNTCRAQGRAMLYSVLRYDSTVYRSGLPNISAVVRGRRVYDPRTGATGWSANAALCVADYITSDFGLRAGWDEIDLPALIAAANICDEEVSLAGGGTEPRYSCNGTFDLDEAPGRILERLLSSMAGTAIYTGGKWVIVAGAWVSPTVTLTENDLRGPVQVRANRAARDLFNGVRAVYVRPLAGYQPTDAPPLIDAQAINEDGGVEVYQDFQFDFTTSGTTAQRLMQIALRKNRKQRQVSLALNMRGLSLRCGDTVTLSLPRLPADTYRITSWSLAADGVDVTLDQEDANVWAWNPATDERPLGDVGEVTFPGGLGLTAPAIAVTTPSTAVPSTVSGTLTTVSGATSYELQWRGPGSSVWNAVSFTHPNWTASTAGRAAFRARAIAADNVSAWDDVTIPAAPTNLSATGDATDIDISWTLPAGAAKAQIFVHTAEDYSASTKQGTEPTATNGTLSITPGNDNNRWIWVRAVDADGNFGPPAGPLVATRLVGSGGTLPGDTGTAGDNAGGGGDGGDGGSGSDGSGDGGGDGGE